MPVHPLDFIVRIGQGQSAAAISYAVKAPEAFTASNEPVAPPSDDAWSIGVPFAQVPTEISAEPEGQSSAEPGATADAP